MWSYLNTKDNIDKAQVNQQGQVAWTGGLKTIAEELNEGIRDKGIYVIPPLSDGTADTTSLTQIGGSTAKFAVVVGLGFFRFDANSIPPLPAGSFMGTDGVWKLVSTTVPNPSVTAFGAGGLSVTITHGLNTTYPTILVFQKTANATGLPYTVVKNTTDTVVDANNVTVTFPATTTSVHLIVVKP